MSIFKSLQFWFVTSIALTTLVILLSVRLFLGPPPHGPGIIKQMDLSAEQQERLDKLLKESRSDLRTRRMKIREAEEEFKEKLTSNTATEEELTAFFEKVDKHKSGMGRARFNLALKIRAIVGPEKLKNFRHLIKPHRRHKKRHPHRSHKKEKDRDRF